MLINIKIFLHVFIFFDFKINNIIASVLAK